MKGIFVTGTDTDCGKTRVACALITALRARGRKVAPFKPVAAGARRTPEGLRNADAEALIAASGVDWPYSLVNPYCLEPALAPHLAAADAGVQIELPVIQEAARRLRAEADLLVVEGAGGWLAPLAEGLDVRDLALALELPVLLVVGLRLGCINHARLSAVAISAGGARLAAWAASQVDPDMARVRDNLETLAGMLNPPLLGVLPVLEGGESGAGRLDVDVLGLV
jgi:dethiobiotin synthetase